MRDNGAGWWTRDVLWLCVGEGVVCCEEVTCGGVVGNVEVAVQGPSVIIDCVELKYVVIQNYLK